MTGYNIKDYLKVLYTFFHVKMIFIIFHLEFKNMNEGTYFVLLYHKILTSFLINIWNT